ncbi:MAG: outer membrane beta-barrel protein [Gammaproteobacteria bacterium]|jgi:OmpA-OmpF porin, OOP family
MKLITTMKNTQHLLFGVLLLSVSVAAYGKDEINTSILEFSLNLGYYSFDSQRELEDTGILGWGFGMHLSRRWAVLLNYTALNTKRTGSQAGETVDGQKYHADVYRFFNTQHRFRPYIVAGFGGADFISEGDKRNETQWNGGLGLSYRITPKWFLRGDARVFYNPSGSNTDYVYMMSLGFRLKEGERGP